MLTLLYHNHNKSQYTNINLVATKQLALRMKTLAKNKYKLNLNNLDIIVETE